MNVGLKEHMIKPGFTQPLPALQTLPTCGQHLTQLSSRWLVCCTAHSRCALLLFAESQNYVLSWNSECRGIHLDLYTGDRAGGKVTP